jgi:hypothetical protein
LDDIGASIARIASCHGGPNRILPMIFASARYSITLIGSNVALCEKVSEV